MKKVLFLIAFVGFQPKEYSEPKKILENAGVEIITASNQKATAVSAYTNLEVKVDLSLEEVVPEDYDGIFLIGGPGALEYLDNEKVYNIMRGAKEKGKLWGAICISPRILAKAGLLKNKKLTGWNGDKEFKEILENVGAEYVEQAVVVGMPVLPTGQAGGRQGEKLITASGPESAEEFGKAILENL